MTSANTTLGFLWVFRPHDDCVVHFKGFPQKCASSYQNSHQNCAKSRQNPRWGIGGRQASFWTYFPRGTHLETRSGPQWPWTSFRLWDRDSWTRPLARGEAYFFFGSKTLPNRVFWFWWKSVVKDYRKITTEKTLPIGIIAPKARKFPDFT